MPSRKNGRSTENRDSRGRFGPGNSGRPPGSRNKATEAASVLLEGEAETLTRKAIELALEGDLAALRLCLERVLPPKKDAPVLFQLPKMTSAADAAHAASSVLTEVSTGKLTPNEGSKCLALIEYYRRTLETSDLEGRIEALESTSRP